MAQMHGELKQLVFDTLAAKGILGKIRVGCPPYPRRGAQRRDRRPPGGKAWPTPH